MAKLISFRRGVSKTTMILNAGLNLEIKNGKLFFDGVPVEPTLRTSEEMKDVFSGEVAEADEIIYLMHRNLCNNAHAWMMVQYNVRYDVTVIFPRMLGNEFAKTLGHYHSVSKEISYPEVYEVLAGKAHFLLQKVGGNHVEDAVVLEAGEGEAVIVPPGYGHVTINPTNEIVVVSDLQSASTKADYGPIKKLHGAAYFETRGGFVKNPNYTNHALRIIKAGGIKEKYLGAKRPIYTIFVTSPEKFSFLNNPEKFAQMMEESIAG